MFRCLLLMAATFCQLSCAGGPDSVFGDLDGQITDVTIIAGGRTRAVATVIPDADSVSPQTFSVFAGFGDADEISDEAEIVVEDGRLTIDVRRVEERLRRDIGISLSVRDLQSIEFDGVGYGELIGRDPPNLIKVSGGAAVEAKRVGTKDTEHIRLTVEDSTFGGTIAVGRFEVVGTNAGLPIRGVSRELSMTLIGSTQTGGSIGGEDSTEIDLVRSHVRSVCALGPLRIDAKEESTLAYRPRCLPDDVVPLIEADETSEVSEIDF